VLARGALARPRRFVLSTATFAALAVAMAALPSAARADHDGFAPPDHDNGNAAFSIELNTTLENHGVRGATVQAGEWLVCKGNDYRHTVWYTFSLPARGQVIVTVRGTSIWDGLPLDTVIAVSGEGSIGDPPIDCDDDGTGQIGGGSRLDLTLNAGTYYIQVGTYNYDLADPSYRPLVVGPDVGSFSIDLRFNQDFDLDDDGFAGGLDCNDGNAGINPNAVDIEFNGIDEDCKGGDDRDRDNDGFPQGVDCNDGKRSVNPGVREVPGDFEDENCDGKKPAALLDPFPAVVFPTLAYSGRTKVTKLEIKDVAKGYRVRVLCKGGGCPRKTLKRRVRSRKSTRIGAYSAHSLRPGAIVEVYVTEPGTNSIGKYVRFQIRSGKAPKRIDCRVAARSGKPTACKAS
jgi:hypothetical protein